MAFEEIKAKLGLDISGFQKGLAGAQRGVGELAQSTTKKLVDLKDAGRTLATALGLNLQSIAEGVARLVTGFSQEQEQALKDMVAASDQAARAVESARDAAFQKNKRMTETLAEREERIRFEKLSDEQKLDELYKRRDQLTQQAISTKKGSTVNLEARLKLLDTEEEIEKVKDRQFQKTKAEYEQTVKTEQALEDGVADIVAMIGEEQKRITEEEKKQVELAKKKSEELAKQRRELEAQLAAQKQSLRDARRDSVLPSMADVISGKRNIGSGAKRTATGLERERERSNRLADKVQRDFENLQGATTESARENARRQLARSQAALVDSQKKVRAGEKSLTGRVTDANPFKNMEEGIKDTVAQLKTLNETTLAPTSVN